MSLGLQKGANSICWHCIYWDWEIEIGAKYGSAWVNICHSPLELEATDCKITCEGYRHGHD